eukprot:TRINITY_DN16524_c0_g1_i1.p1 TRINITY_DN16524_c0_g1~~TRINITY_DN16524_c0_g1_i1.p1  ORF type:complete len:293 (+),score=53.69 TRINITY_DN16524_c0_g1_i1:87-965(+)
MIEALNFDLSNPTVAFLCGLNTVMLAIIIALFAKNFTRRKTGEKILDGDWARALEEKEAVVTKDVRPAQQSKSQYVPYDSYKRLPQDVMQDRAKVFYDHINTRRTVRKYSSESFPVSIIQDCIKAAGTAPSGANLQPWTYVIVKSQSVKDQIQELVENEEALNYSKRMRESWKQDLLHLGTTDRKPYLSEAPYLVCVFKHTYRIDEDGERLAVYYPEQSVGISVGLFQAALHTSGLTTLTSTPMGAETGIREILCRPENERLYLLMPVGYPADDLTIPNITRKSLNQISAIV